MQVLKTKDSVKYRECIYLDGRAIFSPRFDRKTDAKEWKARLMSERQNFLATGQKVEIQPTQKFLIIGFKKYALHWLDNRVKARCTRRTYETYKSNLIKHLIPFFKDRPLDKITLQDGDKLTMSLQDSKHNSKGINLIFGVLKRVLIEATREEVIDKNPLTHFKSLKVRPRPDVFLTDMEISQLLNSNRNSHLYPLFVTALNTGLRKGELGGLCWDRVNFETNLIEVTRSRDWLGLDERLKTNTSRRYVPMNKETRRLLMELRSQKRGKDYVFVDLEGVPIDIHHLYRDFRKAQENAGMVRKVRFHDLRHTFASHFMMKGGNIYDLQKILGHSSMDMTQRYAHLSPDHLIRAINVVNFSSTSEIGFEGNTANIQPGKILKLS